MPTVPSAIVTSPAASSLQPTSQFPAYTVSLALVHSPALRSAKEPMPVTVSGRDPVRSDPQPENAESPIYVRALAPVSVSASGS